MPLKYPCLAIHTTREQEAYNKLERVSSSVHVVEFGPPKKENKPDFYEAKNQS